MKKLITIAAALAFAGTATADDMAKKAPEPKKTPDAKKPEPKKEEPKKMELPKPAQELVDVSKGMVGNWKCTGKALMDPASNAWGEMKGTLKMALDLDKFWIKGEMAGEMNKVKIKMTEYITYDPSQKKWYRLAVDSMGGHEVMWSDGMKDGKSSWQGEQRGMGMVLKTKVNADMSVPKEFKVTGEASMDGKKWMNSFEMSCKK